MNVKYIAFAIPMFSLAAMPQVDASHFGRADGNRPNFEKGARGVHQFMKEGLGLFQKGPRFGMTEGVDRSEEKLANGIITTFTSTDEEVIAKLKSLAGKVGQNSGRSEDVSVSVEVLANGIKITKTTTNEDILERMHDRVDQQVLQKSITREVTNVDNGVQITITSDNADAVEQIQSRKPRGPRNDNVSVSSTNIANGVQVAITSEDEALVERIQERHEEGAEKRHRGGRGKLRQGTGQAQKMDGTGRGRWNR